MNDLETVRVTFTCSHCGTVNELTASHVHDGTVIHCSKCGSSVAPLGALRAKVSDVAAASIQHELQLEQA